MKRTKTKKPKKLAKKPAKKISAEEAETQIIDLESEVLALRLQVQSLVDEVDTKRRKWLAETMQESSNFFQAMQNAMLGDLFAFMKEAPVWELCQISDLGVNGTSDPKVLKPLYAKGWRMLGFHYDPTSGDRLGVVLHRPKIPASFEKFKELYQDFLVGKAPPRKPPKQVAQKKTAAKKAAKRALKTK